MNGTSRELIDKYTDVGSPWGAPFLKLKYLVVLPQFIMQGSWLHNNLFIWFTKLVLKPSFSNTIMRKFFNESKAFSVSIDRRFYRCHMEPLEDNMLVFMFQDAKIWLLCEINPLLMALGIKMTKIKNYTLP